MNTKARKRKSPTAIKICAQPWCAALARVGDIYCVVHERYPKLRPDYRKADGSMKPWSEEQ